MINSPLEQFQIAAMIPMRVMGFFDVSMTNFLFIGCLGFTIITTFIHLNMKVSNLGENSLFFHPNVWQTLFELISETPTNVIFETIPVKNESSVPLITVLYYFIIINNLLGLVPYSFTTTSHIIITFYIAFSVFLGITAESLQKYGINFFLIFLPANTGFLLALLLVPIEFISYAVKPLSLSMRLFINIMAGHTLLKVIAGFTWKMFVLENIDFILPAFILVLLLGLELGVAVIQAYVFVLLVCIYLRDIY